MNVEIAEREQKCVHKNCPLTMGYYIGGGQFICWLHALVLPGCMEAVRGQEPVALTGDSKSVTGEATDARG